MEQTLYHQKGSEWEKCSAKKGGYRTQQYSSTDGEESIQPEVSCLRRTFVFRKGQNIVATGTRPLSIVINDNQKEWEEILREHPHAGWICQWMLELPLAEECCKILYKGKSKGVSDGSYSKHKDLCSAAWIIQFNHQLNVRGGGIVPGPAGSSNAYQGELGGILGQLLIIYMLEQVHPPTTSYKICIACDGESALYRSLQATPEDFISTNRSFDLISQIMDLKEKIIGTIVPVHVRGHQDRENGSLSDLETLNVQMDLLAKEILNAAEEENYVVPDALPATTGGIPQVDYKDTPICGELASTIRSLISKDRVITWWRYKGRFQEQVRYTDIDWEVMKITTTKLSFAMRRFVSKWTCHHIGIGRMMNLRKSRAYNKCPRCGEENEDTLHVLRCRSKSARKR